MHHGLSNDSLVPAMIKTPVTDGPTTSTEIPPSGRSISVETRIHHEEKGSIKSEALGNKTLILPRPATSTEEPRNETVPVSTPATSLKGRFDWSEIEDIRPRADVNSKSLLVLIFPLLSSTSSFSENHLYLVSPLDHSHFDCYTSHLLYVFQV